MHIDERYRQNPLRRLGFESDDVLSPGSLGAVTARAGVGKTSFIVQLALNAMLRNKRVLHISLDTPIKKVTVWYRELAKRLLEGMAGADKVMAAQLWEAMLPYRFILTMQLDGFSVPRLEERLRDLTEQNIFSPDLLVVDGLPFDETSAGMLADLLPLIEEHGLYAWFSVKTHRHETPTPDGLPAQLAGIDHLFEAIIQLLPEGSDVRVRSLKGGDTSLTAPALGIDASTLLLKRSE